MSLVQLSLILCLVLFWLYDWLWILRFEWFLCASWSYKDRHGQTFLSAHRRLNGITSRRTLYPRIRWRIQPLYIAFLETYFCVHNAQWKAKCVLLRTLRLDSDATIGTKFGVILSWIRTKEWKYSKFDVVEVHIIWVDTSLQTLNNILSFCSFSQTNFSILLRQLLIPFGPPAPPSAQRPQRVP
jgi:hypothetical protein